MPNRDLVARIEYSDKYSDDEYEYRHVILPKELARMLKSRFKTSSGDPVLLAEHEWRGMGVQQSRGWEHYAWHKPEPHILLFRRALGTDPTTGQVDPKMAAAARAAYYEEYGLAPKK